jgi:hypothetical protein
MVSDDRVTRTREASKQSFRVLVEALVARGYTPEAARNFVISHENMISNLAVHGYEETHKGDHS